MGALSDFNTISTSTASVCVGLIMYNIMLMRDEKEGRKGASDGARTHDTPDRDMYIHDTLNTYTNPNI